jgi:hypothetical protein
MEIGESRRTYTVEPLEDPVPRELPEEAPEREWPAEAPGRAGAGAGPRALNRAGAPDYAAPTVGWRGWLVAEVEGALRLCSPRFWTVWLPRAELVALCRLGERSYWPLRQLVPAHAAPDEGCRCGI